MTEREYIDFVFLLGDALPAGIVVDDYRPEAFDTTGLMDEELWLLGYSDKPPVVERPRKGLTIEWSCDIDSSTMRAGDDKYARQIAREIAPRASQEPASAPPQTKAGLLPFRAFHALREAERAVRDKRQIDTSYRAVQRRRLRSPWGRSALRASARFRLSESAYSQRRTRANSA